MEPGKELGSLLVSDHEDSSGEPALSNEPPNCFFPQPPLPFEHQDTTNSLNEVATNIENLLFVGCRGSVAKYTKFVC